MVHSSGLFYLKTELSYEVSFFACGKESIEVNNLFNHFMWVWLDVPKVIQNNKLEWNYIWNWLEWT